MVKQQTVRRKKLPFLSHLISFSLNVNRFCVLVHLEIVEELGFMLLFRFDPIHMTKNDWSHQFEPEKTH